MSIPPFPQTPYASITHEMLEAELIVVIRHEGVTIDRLPSVYDVTFTALGSAIKSGLFIPVGPALGVYHGDPTAAFDIEIGFPAMGAPTADIPTGAGVIHASALPAGPCAIVSHIGSFDGLGAAWGQLVDGAEGTPSGTWIEVYVSDPSVIPEDERRTDLVLPLKSA